MPDRRRHRGPHPSDRKLFGAEWLPPLRLAVRDLSWLLSRGYAEKSAVKVVGDRYRLRQRQRVAVMRCACSDVHLESRARRSLDADAARGRPILLDGYNVLTTVEAALAKGVLIRGRDGCLRDMASMHGSWRRVEETARAIRLIGGELSELRPGAVTWYLDSPVSNSGRLAETLLDAGHEDGWNWHVKLVPDPDPVLARAGDIVATADSVVLDAGGPWFNLAGRIVERQIPDAWVLDLGIAPV